MHQVPGEKTRKAIPYDGFQNAKQPLTPTFRLGKIFAIWSGPMPSRMIPKSGEDESALGLDNSGEVMTTGRKREVGVVGNYEIAKFWTTWYLS